MGGVLGLALFEGVELLTWGEVGGALGAEGHESGEALEASAVAVVVVGQGDDFGGAEGDEEGALSGLLSAVFGLGHRGEKMKG